MNPLTIALKNELIQTLQKANAFKKGDFTLTSGEKSDYYIDCRPALLNSYRMAAISNAWMHSLHGWLTPQHVLCGVPTSGLIMVAGLLQKMTTYMEVDSCYVRLNVRDHGTGRSIEGDFHDDSKIIVLDDVASTGGTIFKTIDTLLNAGYHVSHAGVIVDRSVNSIVAKMMKNINIEYTSLLTMKDCFDDHTRN